MRPSSFFCAMLPLLAGLTIAPAFASTEPPAKLPAGHPAVGSGAAPAEGGKELPPGHPPASSAKAQTKEPAPEDSSDIDPSLPPGVIAVEVLDAHEQPVAHADVTLGILQQSVAKGESRRRTTQPSDATGGARFEGLEFGGGVAYRVTVPWIGNSSGDPATYAAMPFQLDLKHGQRVRVHVYPVSNHIDEVLVGMQAIVYMELKDDVVQFDEIFQLYNVGQVTWVPNDVVLTLPAGYKAFSAQREMSDTGFDEAPGKGAKLRGTFSPGQHEMHFRYQMPYDGEETFSASVMLPPHIARVRVIAEASKGMTLQVKDFPSAQLDRTQQGQRVLVTERQLRSGEQPIARVHVGLNNIPTEGSAKWIAVAIAAATIGLGLFVALNQAKGAGKPLYKDPDAERARARLVVEIAALDRAHGAGELGPKAYARIREALIDALARVMAQSA